MFFPILSGSHWSSASKNPSHSPRSTTVSITGGTGAVIFLMEQTQGHTIHMILHRPHRADGAPDEPLSTTITSRGFKVCAAMLAKARPTLS